jgi:hypothetical protein
MAGTVITDLQFFTGATTGISNCDSTTDWSGGTLDTESKIEGTGCLSAKVSNTTATYTFSCQTTNLSGKAIYAWLMNIVPKGLDTKANGGMRIGIRDTAGNTGDWFVAGRDTYTGGWECFVVDVSQPFDVQSGTPNITAVNGIRITFKTIQTTAKINCFWDAVRFGTYIGVKGGTPADPATFQDILNADDTYAYGAFRLGVGGIIFAQAKLVFGSNVAGENTYFKDTTAPIILFRNRKVSDNWWRITFVGNPTGTTEIYFGEKLGGTGVNGPLIRTEQQSYVIDLTDTNVTKYGLYGAFIDKASTVMLAPYSADKEVNECVFTKCGEIVPDTGLVTKCRFIGSSGRALKISSTSHHVTNCDFINNYVAIRHDVGGTYTYDALMFYGNTYDVENTSTDPVIINRINGSNPVTKLENPGSITINPLSVLVKVTVLDIVTKQAIPNARVLIEATSGGPLDPGTDILFGLTDTDGTISTTFQYTADQPITGRVRRGTSSYGILYKPFEISGTITSAGFQTTVLLVRDE